ncbi:receptor-like protein eix2 [Quercus suber]|uniref:Receptor-like protein eix2 n=1 Tax=Quercus suber TaxID=58331 RepID=A0AAW0K0B7_QUESU
MLQMLEVTRVYDICHTTISQIEFLQAPSFKLLMHLATPAILNFVVFSSKKLHSKNCTVDEEPLNRTPIGKTEDHSENYSFYMGSGVGFVVGFWAVCGVLFFKRNWRHAYLGFLDDIKDWVYVTTIVNCVDQEHVVYQEEEDELL